MPETPHQNLQLHSSLAELGTFEVADFEHTGTRFRGRSLKLGTVDLKEVVGFQVFSEQVTDGGLQLEDRLVCRGLLFEKRSSENSLPYVAKHIREDQERDCSIVYRF